MVAILTLSFELHQFSNMAKLWQLDSHGSAKKTIVSLLWYRFEIPFLTDLSSNRGRVLFIWKSYTVLSTVISLINISSIFISSQIGRFSRLILSATQNKLINSIFLSAW